MATELLTIRERIMRRLVEICRTIKDVKKVERYDQRGNTDDEFSIVVSMDTDEAERDALGNDGNDPDLGTRLTTFSVLIILLVHLRQDDTTPGDQIFSRYLGRIRSAIQADPRLRETDAAAEALAYDVDYTGSEHLERTDNDFSMYIAARFEITSSELDDDPFRRPFMDTAKTG